MNNPNNRAFTPENLLGRQTTRLPERMFASDEWRNFLEMRDFMRELAKNDARIVLDPKYDYYEETPDRQSKLAFNTRNMEEQIALIETFVAEDKEKKARQNHSGPFKLYSLQRPHDPLGKEIEYKPTRTQFLPNTNLSIEPASKRTALNPDPSDPRSKLRNRLEPMYNRRRRGGKRHRTRRPRSRSSRTRRRSRSNRRGRTRSHSRK